MYLTPTENHWAADLEADNLLDKATTIYCLCLRNVVSKQGLDFTEASAFVKWLASNPSAVLVGHNFLAYDLVMLNRFWKAGIGAKRVVDTFVLSQLYNPSYPRPQGCQKGPHSLEAWGIRLKYPKSEHSDFTAFTPAMLRYCQRDTNLAALLFLRLTERMRQVGFTEDGCEIEHLAWNNVQNKQKKHGFPFNEQAAQELYVTIRQREEELKDAIYRLWPPTLEVIGSYKGRLKKNGSESAQYLRHLGQYPRVESLEGNAYQVYDYVAFNLGSPSQRIEKLLALRWKPVNKTKKGNPKIDEDELLAFAELSGNPEIAMLAKWIVFNSRANMVRTWLDAVNPVTRAIHGSLFIASTLRYRHSGPNSANIPAVRTRKVDGTDIVLYGEDGTWTYECRDLWIAGDDDFVLVGIDGTGIQNRNLIHNLIKTVGEDAVRDFKELALAGDVHKRNIEVLGLANKTAAKKFYYTLMMGGGGARLAADQAQFGTIMSAKEGDKKKDKMVASIPGFGRLISNLQRELAETGRIKLCDGTPVLVPSPHMVIPYLLQGDESRLMKRALAYVDEEIRRHRLQNDVFKVADIHDEWQFKVRKPKVELFKSLVLPCFVRAGKSFGYNIQIDGDAKVGNTWAETH